MRLSRGKHVERLSVWADKSHHKKDLLRLLSVIPYTCTNVYVK